MSFSRRTLLQRAVALAAASASFSTLQPRRGNFTHDPFRSVADSAEYVKRVLLQQ